MPPSKSPWQSGASSLNLGTDALGFNRVVKRRHKELSSQLFPNERSKGDSSLGEGDLDFRLFVSFPLPPPKRLWRRRRRLSVSTLPSSPARDADGISRLN